MIDSNKDWSGYIAWCKKKGIDHRITKQWLEAHPEDEVYRIEASIKGLTAWCKQKGINVKSTKKYKALIEERDRIVQQYGDALILESEQKKKKKKHNKKSSEPKHHEFYLPPGDNKDGLPDIDNGWDWAMPQDCFGHPVDEFGNPPF